LDNDFGLCYPLKILFRQRYFLLSKTSSREFLMPSLVKAVNGIFADSDDGQASMFGEHDDGQVSAIKFARLSLDSIIRAAMAMRS
jgi:hypothetical protein